MLRSLLLVILLLYRLGNLAIVSSFLPEIEIWDLDVNNAIEPLLILGGEKE
jgi:periodic tryptophan protein 1